MSREREVRLFIGWFLKFLPVSAALGLPFVFQSPAEGNISNWPQPHQNPTNTTRDSGGNWKDPINAVFWNQGRVDRVHDKLGPYLNSNGVWRACEHGSYQKIRIDDLPHGGTSVMVWAEGATNNLPSDWSDGAGYNHAKTSGNDCNPCTDPRYHSRHFGRQYASDHDGFNLYSLTGIHKEGGSAPFNPCVHKLYPNAWHASRNEFWSTIQNEWWVQKDQSLLKDQGGGGNYQEDMYGDPINFSGYVQHVQFEDRMV